MSHSTTEILKNLFTSPLSIVKGGFATHQTDSEEGNTEGILQLKVKNPKLNPLPKNKLTPEQQQLEKAFELAKHTLEKFKDILRQQGLDVSHYSVSKSPSGRIIYHISNPTHFDFFINEFAKRTDVREEPSLKRRMK